MDQAFVIGEPKMLHTDNGKEFVNELLTNWVEKYQEYIGRKISSIKSRSSWRF